MSYVARIVNMYLLCKVFGSRTLCCYVYTLDGVVSPNPFYVIVINNKVRVSHILLRIMLSYILFVFVYFNCISELKASLVYIIAIFYTDRHIGNVERYI